MTQKNLKMLALFVTLGLTAIYQSLGQSAYVVTITDMRKNKSYEVMTREAVSQLKNQIRAEGRVFQKAMSAAKKEWESNDLTKEKRFITTGLKARTLRVEGPFKHEAAKKKADKKIERAMDSEYKDALARDKNKKRKLSDREAEKLERKQQQEMQAEAAVELIKKHTEALMTEAK